MILWELVARWVSRRICMRGEKTEENAEDLYSLYTTSLEVR